VAIARNVQIIIKLPVLVCVKIDKMPVATCDIRILEST
jgi:hypothetical protein